MSRLVRKDVDVGTSLFRLEASPVRAAVNTVAPALAAAAGAAAANQTEEVDNYATRIVKYVPAEVIAFFLAADKLFSKAPNLAGASIADKFVADYLYYFSVAVFAIALVGTPIYLWLQRDNGQPWIVHAAISTVAFVIWAYAVQGGLFALYPSGSIYSSAIAGALVLVFTFVSGFFKPGR